MGESDYLEKIEREKAKARQGTRIDLNIVATLPQSDGGKVRDIVSEKISERGLFSQMLRYGIKRVFTKIKRFNAHRAVLRDPRL